MTLRDHLTQAIESLLGAERTRAVLALLGVIAGTGAVVAALSIGEGAQRQALAEIGSLGLDTVVIRAQHLSTAELGAIARGLGETASVAGLKRLRATLVVDSSAREITIVGASSQWLSMIGASVARGRVPLSADDGEGRRVIWLGPSLAQGMGAYLQEPPIVTVAGQPFRVAGDLRARGAGRISGLGVDLEDAAVVPLRALAMSDALSEIVLRAPRISPIELKRRALRVLTHAGRRADAYDVIVPRELLAARLRTERGLGWLVLAIGLLALIGSGIGIMNLMLATVRARTPEIGLRRAVGARARDVLLHFTLEAGLLAVTGACGGTLAGIAFALGCGYLAGWPTAIAPGALALGWALAFGVTVGFGVYPAHVATRITPVIAIGCPEI